MYYKTVFIMENSTNTGDNQFKRENIIINVVFGIICLIVLICTVLILIYRYKKCKQTENRVNIDHDHNNELEIQVDRVPNPLYSNKSPVYSTIEETRV